MPHNVTPSVLYHVHYKLEGDKKSGGGGILFQVHIMTGNLIWSEPHHAVQYK